MNIVIINCFDTYEKRVTMLYDLLVSKGHSVTVIASDFRHFNKEYITEKKAGYVYVHAESYKKNLSVARLKSHHNFAKTAIKVVEEIELDLLYVLIPANSLCKYAARYKRRHRDVKLIFDVIDMWPETMPVGNIKKIFPFTSWRKLRDNYIDVAEYVITECKLFEKGLQTVVDSKKLQTVYFAADKYNGTMNYKEMDDKLKLCYLGSINNIIDIDSIKSIIESAGKEVEVHIIGDGEQKEALIDAIESTCSKAIYHGKVYDDNEKANIISTCHFGLNIMKSSVFVGLTMKSVDYMKFGLPIINNIKGDTWDLVDKLGLGINFDSKEDFNEKVKAFDWESGRKSALKFFSENLSKESFESKMLSVMEKMKG